MATARDIMTGKPDCLSAGDTVLEAAKKLAELNLGSVPVCDENGHPTGMITDHDIVAQVVAQGKDPAQSTVGELSQAEPIVVTAEDPVEEAARMMIENEGYRIAVVEEDNLIGLIAPPDIHSNLPPEEAGQFLESLSGTLPGDDPTQPWASGLPRNRRAAELLGDDPTNPDGEDTDDPEDPL
jgi:CBS domain-containing protein